MYLNLFLTNIGTNIVCFSICLFLFFLESLVNYESVNNDIRMPETQFLEHIALCDITKVTQQ